MLFYLHRPFLLSLLLAEFFVLYMLHYLYHVLLFAKLHLSPWTPVSSEPLETGLRLTGSPRFEENGNEEGMVDEAGMMILEEGCGWIMGMREVPMKGWSEKEKVKIWVERNREKERGMDEQTERARKTQ